MIGGSKPEKPINVRNQIFIVRHGERVDDAGHDPETYLDFDPHLTERGKKEAQKAGMHILKLQKKAALGSKFLVISSPFIRCIETAAEIMASLGPESLAQPDILLDRSISEYFHYSKGIKEDPDGKLFYQTKFPELQKAYPKMILTPSMITKDCIIKIPENQDSFLQRTSDFRGRLHKFLVESKEDLSVIVVTHGTAIRGLFWGLSEGRFYVHYCCIGQLGVSDKGELVHIANPGIFID